MKLLNTPFSSAAATPTLGVEREEMLALIDSFTARTVKRGLIEANEVMDFCLDLRLILQNGKV